MLDLFAGAPIPADGGGSGSLTLLVVFIVLAIGVSFLCSIMEAVLLSVSPAYIGALEATKPAVAGRLRELKDDVDRPLAAILTLNTVAHTIGAAGAGAEAAGYFGSGAIGIFSALLTLGILVLSEIIPKTVRRGLLARSRPDRGPHAEAAHLSAVSPRRDVAVVRQAPHPR